MFRHGPHAAWCQFVTIECPTCSAESFLNKGLLNGPAHLNVNRCFTCFTEIRLVSLDPLTIEVSRHG